MTKFRRGLCATSVATLVFAAACSNDSSDCNFIRTCGGPYGTGGQDAGATGGSSGNGGSGNGGSGNGGSAAGASGAGGTSGAGGKTDGGAGDAGTDASTDAPPPCDPTKAPGLAECAIDEQYGVFVSTGGSDVTGDGSRLHPYATIGKGLTVAKTDEKRVYACADGDPFIETITATPDKAEVYGGFRCADWKWDGTLRATINSNDSTAWRIDGAGTGVTLENLQITAANAVGAGASSIGLFATASQNVVLRNVKITAGTGAPGGAGTSVGGSAQSGATGNDGTAACVVATGSNLGGPSVETQCDGTASGSVGGKGGVGGTPVEDPGNGSSGKPSSASSGGEPGIGEISAGWTCDTAAGHGLGRPGANGESKPDAAGATGSGSLLMTGFSPEGGHDGLPGTPGQGGGGGGAAKAPTSCGINATTGASGGSGGGGGCGGKGGGGGSGGGGSFAIAANNVQLTLEDVDLIANSGGKGGDGGTGQNGGGGGDPGRKANGSGSSQSCAGGVGGQGGNGGNGGGGAGGPSVGIAYAGVAPTKVGTVNIQVASTAALGGASGSGATTGSGTGVPGLTENEHAF